MVETSEFQERFKGSIEEARSQGVKPVEFEQVTSFSTHFAEWTFKGGDLLVHLFPRSGRSDKYYPAYLDNGEYRPGRFEEKATATFPDDMRDRIKRAADEVWLGDVAIESVPELGSYTVQFQDAATTAKVAGSKFMDKFCEAMDSELE